MTPSYLIQGTAGNGLFVSVYVAGCLFLFMWLAVCLGSVQLNNLDVHC